MKFITPVSMKVTLAQFETDLLQPLLILGYKKGDCHYSEDRCILATNITYEHDRFSLLYPAYASERDRFFIKEYNPQLFLALAAMTDELNGIAGEWWKHTTSYTSQFDDGCLYKQVTKSILEIHAFGEHLSAWSNNNHKYFVKATKEEIIQHFIIKQQTVSTEKQKTIKLGDLRRLWPLSDCGQWKSIIESYLKTLIYQPDTYEVLIKQEHIDLLIKEGSITQKAAVEAAGVKLSLLDKNAFIAEFAVDAIKDVSKKLFDNDTTLQIATTAAPRDRSDLKGRALYVDNAYKVNIYHTLAGGTTIEITRK